MRFDRPVTFAHTVLERANALPARRPSNNKGRLSQLLQMPVAKPLRGEARVLTQALTPDMPAARAQRGWIERIAESR